MADLGRSVPLDDSVAEENRQYGAIGSKLLLLSRVIPYVLLTLLLIPFQIALVKLRHPWRKRLPLIYHRASLWLIGVKIVRRGRPSKARPTLYVANHASYLDIPIFGALLEASFVAKAEIEKWPLFGFCAKLQECIFIDRAARNTLSHTGEIQRRLDDGDSIILFPEGTTSDGNSTLPFKSSLFATAQLRPNGEPLMVQPVSLSYAKLDGVGMGRGLRRMFTWFGDEDLVPHAANAMSLGKLTVIVEFHPPVTIAQFKNRKEMCAYCEQVVADGVAEGNAGRPQRAPISKRLIPAPVA